MSVYNFFTKLKQQVGSIVLPSEKNAEEAKNTTVNEFSNSQNQDENDGYLLIGIARNEQNAEFPSELNYDSIPTYELVPNELPSYRNVNNGGDTSGSILFSRVELAPLQSEDLISTGNQISPLNDVPFKLHPVLHAQVQANAIFHELNLEPQSFDWSKYSHDFINENIDLRDMNSGDMAEVDEFIFTPFSNSQQCNKLLSRNSKVDLMQF